MNKDYDYLIELGQDYLAHYGVLGMKWGRRKSKRYNNPVSNAPKVKKVQTEQKPKMSKRKKRLLMGLAAAGIIGLSVAKHPKFFKSSLRTTRKLFGVSKKAGKTSLKATKKSLKVIRKQSKMKYKLLNKIMQRRK